MITLDQAYTTLGPKTSILKQILLKKIFPDDIFLMCTSMFAAKNSGSKNSQFFVATYLIWQA